MKELKAFRFKLFNVSLKSSLLVSVHEFQLTYFNSFESTDKVSLEPTGPASDLTQQFQSQLLMLIGLSKDRNSSLS